MDNHGTWVKDIAKEVGYGIHNEVVWMDMCLMRDYPGRNLLLFIAKGDRPAACLPGTRRLGFTASEALWQAAKRKTGRADRTDSADRWANCGA